MTHEQTLVKRRKSRMTVDEQFGDDEHKQIGLGNATGRYEVGRSHNNNNKQGTHQRTVETAQRFAVPAKLSVESDAALALARQEQQDKGAEMHDAELGLVATRVDHELQKQSV